MRPPYKQVILSLSVLLIIIGPPILIEGYDKCYNYYRFGRWSNYDYFEFTTLDGKKVKAKTPIMIDDWGHPPKHHWVAYILILVGCPALGGFTIWWVLKKSKG
jgi:hypothetical protein